MLIFCIGARADDVQQQAGNNPNASAADTQNTNSSFITNTDDLEEIYRELPMPTLQYIHDVDPGESFDMQNNTWSPYPLFKLAAPLYFKTITILPGYYLLTPREQDGRWYMLFKEAGKVRYAIPIYNREMVPMNFYNDNLEKKKYTISQKWHIKLLDFVGNNVKSSKRKPEAQNYLEISDLNNNFISIVLYWGNYKYYIVVRTIAL